MPVINLSSALKSAVLWLRLSSFHHSSSVLFSGHLAQFYALADALPAAVWFSQRSSAVQIGFRFGFGFDFAVCCSVRTLAAPFYMGKKTQEEIHEKVPNFVTHFNIQPSG